MWPSQVSLAPCTLPAPWESLGFRQGGGRGAMNLRPACWVLEWDPRVGEALDQRGTVAAPMQGKEASWAETAAFSRAAGVSLLLAGLTYILLPLLSPTVGSGPRLTRK